MQRLLPLLALSTVACGGSTEPAALDDSAVVDAATDAANDLSDDVCTPPATPKSVDCRNGVCPEVTVAGQTIPAVGFRGLADPSLRKDPKSARIYLGYSFVRPASDMEVILVESRLAKSDDAGATWALVDTLFTNEGPMIDPGGTGWNGYMNSETISLTPAETGGKTSWYSARLSYFTTAPYKPVIRTFTVRIAHADSPEALRSAKEQVIGLTSYVPAAYGAATDLEKLTKLGCDYWNDPGLFFEGGKLYLLAQCVGKSQIHVFASNATDDVAMLAWKDLGALTDAGTAAELGDSELNQSDVVRAADGTLLLLATPSHVVPGTLSAHAGCRAIELESLDPPRLRRQCGKLVVRASVTASDLASTGSCGWDPASSTGIVLARRPGMGEPGTLVRSHVP